MKTETFKTFTASMIAVVTVISALVAWRAAAASQDSSQADFRGLVASVNSEEAQVLNTVKVSEHYQAFLNYTRYNELGNKLDEALKSNPANVGELDRQKSDAWGIAFGLQSLSFPSRYLLPDGTYDSQRELDELLADDERSSDMRPDVHFAEGSTLRSKANLLVEILIPLGIAFWFFTLAQITDHKVNVLFAAIGGLLLGISTFAVLVIELFM